MTVTSLPRDTVRKRLEAGWSVEEALTRSVRPKAPSRKMAEAIVRAQFARAESAGEAA